MEEVQDNLSQLKGKRFEGKGERGIRIGKSMLIKLNMIHF